MVKKEEPKEEKLEEPIVQLVSQEQMLQLLYNKLVKLEEDVKELKDLAVLED